MPGWRAEDTDQDFKVLMQKMLTVKNRRLYYQRMLAEISVEHDALAKEIAGSLNVEIPWGHYRCQHCGLTAPRSAWKSDGHECPHCGKKYDWLEAQDSED